VVVSTGPDLPYAQAKSIAGYHADFSRVVCPVTLALSWFVS
jgi:hypothetical protein